MPSTVSAAAPAFACPACAGTIAAAVATVNVATQHRRIFPCSPAVWDALERASAVTDYQMLECDSCGLVFASPMTAASAAWYQIAYRALHVKPEGRWEYDVILPSLAARDRVFEIGCGTGAFLSRCRSNGIPASGIDFSADAVEVCRAQGLDAAVGAVGSEETDSAIGGAANVIASFHVLEHLEHPDDLFRHATRVAAPAATFWVSVPSNRRIDRALEMGEPLDDPPHHLTKWTDRALAAIGAKHGWRLANVAVEPFSRRSGLWYVASNFGLYQRARSRGWLRLRGVELPFRLALYPVAAVRLFAIDGLAGISGFSMLARYERVDRQ